MSVTNEISELDAPPAHELALSRGESDLLLDGERDTFGPLDVADAAAKRAFDVLVSASALLVLLPVMLVGALVIVLESPGPVFYRSRRIGYKGRELRMLKFRKMRDGVSGLPLTTDDDLRFTRIGVLLAKNKIDEIPQLWHVLRGEMSLVGPRPESEEFVRRHPDAYREILTTRPGITGLSQLAFAEEGRILDDDDPLLHYLQRILPQKIGLDSMYANQRKFLLDLSIIFWTIAAVIARRPVAVDRESGRLRLRRR